MSSNNNTNNNTSRQTILDRWSLKGRNYVVTGGANGIGLATVQALLAHQAAGVLFCSRSEADASLLQSLQQEYSSNGDDDDSITKVVVHHVQCDVSTEEGRAKLVQQAQAIFGNGNSGGNQKHCVHGLINNVGINVRKPILEQTPEEYYTMTRTNMDAAYFLCRSFADLLLVQDGTATIVNVSSAAGVQSSGTGAAYGMTKAALNQLTKILACEWAAASSSNNNNNNNNKGIRVNAVTPWMTMTPMLQAAVQTNPSQLDKVHAWTPMHRLASAQEVADPIVFLCLSASSYITGQILGVDGGLTAQGFDGPCVTPPDS
jgi:tropinone reductase I